MFEYVCSCLCQAAEEDGSEERVEMDENRVTTRHSEGEDEVMVDMEDPVVSCYDI